MTSDDETIRRPPRGPVGNVVRGMWLLGRGDAEGMNCFRPGSEALLSALAPNLALFLVIGVLQLFQTPTAVQLTKIPLLLTVLLACLVVSQAFAVRWNRGGLWARYATATLWTNWLPQILFIIVPLLLYAAAPAFAQTRTATIIVLLVIEAYGLWLTWFVARVGLVLSRGRAAALVSGLLAVTGMLYLLAAFLPPHYDATRDLVAPLFRQS